MSISFEVTLETGMAEALTQELRLMALPRLEQLRIDAELFVKELFREALLGSETFAALVSGRLREELGLEDGEGMALSVVNALVNAVAVAATPGSNADIGTISISIIRGRFEAALAAPGASYVSHSKVRGTSLTVPWLNWLLFAGTERVTVAELLVDYPNRSVSARSGSRTGKALMIYRDFTSAAPAGRRNRKLGRTSQGYRLPAAHAGVESDNWVTRAAYQTIPRLEEFLSRRLQAFWG